MKKLAFTISLMILSAVAQANTDVKAIGCQVTKITSHSKTGATDISYVEAMILCQDSSSTKIFSSNPLAGQILANARSTGARVDVKYRNFTSSFDGQNGFIVDISQ